MPLHFYIGSGDDMDQFTKWILDIKPDVAAFYTPKLFEMLASKTFKDAKDLSFISVIQVAGSQFSAAMYERLEEQIKPKIKNGKIPLINK